MQRRSLAKKVEPSPRDSTRAAVLYLRDFGHDRPTGLNRLSYTSEEEQLIKALSVIGPAIAIGRPGEDLPPLGAPRAYFAADQWQQRVSELIRSARVVLIQTGKGDGLRWEVEHVITWVKPEQLLVAVFVQQSFRTFQRWTSSVIQWPEEGIVFKHTIGGYLSGFVVFDDKWCPTAIRVRRFSPFRGGFLHTREFRSALAPIIRRFAA